MEGLRSIVKFIPIHNNYYTWKIDKITWMVTPSVTLQSLLVKCHYCSIRLTDSPHFLHSYSWAGHGFHTRCSHWGWINPAAPQWKISLNYSVLCDCCQKPPMSSVPALISDAEISFLQLYPNNYSSIGMVIVDFLGGGMKHILFELTVVINL